LQELVDFYGRYIAAFNAGDVAAFAACFHPPVTMMRPDRGEGGAEDRAVTVVEDPGALALRMPGHWARSTIDAVHPLDDVLPFAAGPGLPEPRRRLGLVADVSRWDHDGRVYEQVQALYLLSRRHGRLGIVFVADLGFTRRRQEPPGG